MAPGAAASVARSAGVASARTASSEASRRSACWIVPASSRSRPATAATVGSPLSMTRPSASCSSARAARMIARSVRMRPISACRASAVRASGRRFAAACSTSGMAAPTSSWRPVTATPSWRSDVEMAARVCGSSRSRTSSIATAWPVCSRGSR
ncbi:MAG: hypothetical protein AUI14_19720 [Actinobacteria bacterium 13_2_20CM_2_71_6]|nr:MAG: hypothetical protein AUI14_19720 [Actinobacteria bacterium 13_2_20CM_2_71_6]